MSDECKIKLGSLKKVSSSLKDCDIIRLYVDISNCCDSVSDGDVIGVMVVIVLNGKRLMTLSINKR